MTNDIQNLLSRFGATSESYLEVDDFPEYREPPRVESPPPGVTRERPFQAEKQAHIVAAPQELAAAPAAIIQPEAVGNPGDNDGKALYAVTADSHALLRSLLEKLARASTERRTAAEVIAVVSMNGGVGKSTLSAASSGTVDGGGRRIVLDLDPQDALVLCAHLNASVTHGHAS